MRATVVLLLLNVAAFVVQVIAEGNGLGLAGTLGVALSGWWQVWRYLTFQFLHAGLWHILFNMLALYMFGSALERQWGSPRLLAFYLVSGAGAGVAYVVMGLLAGGAAQAWTPLIGASGGVYGMILACMVLFPQMRVMLLLFPMSMRTLGFVVFGVAVLIVLGGLGQGGRTGDFWSQVAHLGGAGTAAMWIWWLPHLHLPRWGRKEGAGLGPSSMREGAWQKRLSRRRKEEAEIDGILDKIHRDGIGSLTRGEKKILRDATRRQREEERSHR
jgi:membrane associated rhomboid family serine protease